MSYIVSGIKFPGKQTAFLHSTRVQRWRQRRRNFIPIFRAKLVYGEKYGDMFCVSTQSTSVTDRRMHEQTETELRGHTPHSATASRGKNTVVTEIIHQVTQHFSIHIIQRVSFGLWTYFHRTVHQSEPTKPLEPIILCCNTYHPFVSTIISADVEWCRRTYIQAMPFLCSHTRVQHTSSDDSHNLTQTFIVKDHKSEARSNERVSDTSNPRNRENWNNETTSQLSFN